ncbi:aminoglycoside phosphotransferase family protein [Rossellomorea vietnamensis]|uniref:Aminoglycoside phosphotransferase family protein n=2 Tax=Rossellomorea vietnamensis TaxID=218284 RepID=A0A5D4NZD9_9BACI|nr:aminoglycoside phosphotransferase family protein [Rossellomorea vietnamensis]
MKMTSKIDMTSGDGFQNRLLFLLKSKLGSQTLTLRKIKEGKWKVQTDYGNWFLKLYSSSRRLELQKEVMEELSKEGFIKIPSFHPIHQTDSIVIDGKAAGLTKWINTVGNFTYHTYSERQEALAVLEKFHRISRAALMRKEFNSLKDQRLLEKWRARLDEFVGNRQKLSVLVPLEVIDTYILLGEQALAGMVKSGFSEEPCILHGDLAHHNFLRDTNQELLIIDLDLISSGPPEVDYIQFANRIFPHINWSLDLLWKHGQLSKYKESSTFLHSILYSSDIFREWNRFFRESRSYQKSVWYYLIDLTLYQFQSRMACCREIQKNL